jgi:hypothetical protein
MQAEMKRTASTLPLPLTTSKLVNKLPRESPKVNHTHRHKSVNAPHSRSTEEQARRQR